MKVVIDGTPEEIRALFQREGIDALTSTQLAPELDVERLATELGWLKAGARNAVRFICENAPRVDFDDVADHVGVDTRRLSGMMSSVGHSAPSVGRLFGRVTTGALMSSSPRLPRLC